MNEDMNSDTVSHDATEYFVTDRHLDTDCNSDLNTA
jgi:hypothetical protein